MKGLTELESAIYAAAWVRLYAELKDMRCMTTQRCAEEAVRGAEDSVRIYREARASLEAQ